MKKSSQSEPDTVADVISFQAWMAGDGYAAQTQKEYPYFLRRYCAGYQRSITDQTLATEADVERVVADVERAIEHGGRWAGEFNYRDLTANLRPALRAYVRFVTESGATSVANDVPVDELPPRLKTVVTRVVRDSAVVRKLKALHEHTCQICNARLELFPGKYYSEGHHLKPLGQSHSGLDVLENLLCVCPNCHVKLDYAAIRIDPTSLRTKAGHTIRPEFVAYHNALCK